MALYHLALEGSTSSSFSSPVSITIGVFGVATYKTPLGEVKYSWGHKGSNPTKWIRKFVVQVYPFSVTASGYDYGDYTKLEDLLYMPYLRIKRTGTNLPRTNTTSSTDHNFWTHATLGLLSNSSDGSEKPFNVVRVSGPELSPDFATGTDRLTFTLEATEPNV